MLRVTHTHTPLPYPYTHLLTYAHSYRKIKTPTRTRAHAHTFFSLFIYFPNFRATSAKNDGQLTITSGIFSFGIARAIPGHEACRDSQNARPAVYRPASRLLYRLFRKPWSSAWRLKHHRPRDALGDPLWSPSRNRPQCVPSVLTTRSTIRAALRALRTAVDQQLYASIFVQLVVQQSCAVSRAGVRSAVSESKSMAGTAAEKK